MKVKNDDFGGDSVKSPSHYNSHPSGVECIDITQHLNFCLGNAIKYIWRCDDKSKPVEDLKKAIKYLEFEIERREALTGPLVGATRIQEDYPPHPPRRR